MLATELPIKILEAKLFATLGVFCKLFSGAEKMTIGPEFNFDLQLFRVVFVTDECWSCVSLIRAEEA